MERSIAVYRIIRRVTPPESPYAGRLVADGDTVVVLVDVDTLGAGWVGWSRDPDAHLCTPIDIARSEDGHDVVLPWCSERLDRYLDRREQSPVAGGEAVTVLVSALRAVHAARVGLPRTAAGPSGNWWLTDAGRPLFCDGGTEPIESATATVARRIANTTHDRVIARIAGEIADLLGDVGALGGDWLDACERRLFAACAARPLVDPVVADGDELDEEYERSPRLGVAVDGGRARGASRGPHVGDRSLSVHGRRAGALTSGDRVHARGATRRQSLAEHLRERWGPSIRWLRPTHRDGERRAQGRSADHGSARAERSRSSGAEGAAGRMPRQAVERPAARPDRDGETRVRGRIRGAPLLVGAAAAAGVLTVGLLWPM